MWMGALGYWKLDVECVMCIILYVSHTYCCIMLGLFLAITGCEFLMWSVAVTACDLLPPTGCELFMWFVAVTGRVVVGGEYSLEG